MTMISIIVAMSKNHVIGLNNKLPWHIPEELQYFKQLTMDKPIIMGRKTFDSIGRRLLPGRRTIILTRDTDLHGEGFAVANSVSEALQIAGEVPEVMIVGGSGIYAEFLPLANRVYLSIIPQDSEGDAYFPVLDAASWHLIEQQQYPKFLAQIFENITINNKR